MNTTAIQVPGYKCAIRYTSPWTCQRLKADCASIEGERKQLGKGGWAQKLSLESRYVTNLHDREFQEALANAT
jgi:hypothetical protein